MKKKIAIILIIILLPMLFWGASYLYCEHLTKQYSEAILADIEDELIYPGWKLDSFKVLKYRSGKSAQVYSIEEDIEDGLQEGWVHILSYQNDQWQIDVNGVRGWSQFGSADDPVWPYDLLPG